MPTLTNVTHRGGVVRLFGLEEEAAFVAVHNDGNVTLYDGDSGNVLSSLQACARVCVPVRACLCRCAPGRAWTPGLRSTLSHTPRMRPLAAVAHMRQ